VWSSLALVVAIPPHDLSDRGSDTVEPFATGELVRVVRHLPVRAEASKLGEAWGQVLGKP
jgi:hypothetical protein